MRTSRLTIDGLSVAVHESDGTGPAAVLLHSNSASGAAFRRQLDSPLGARYRLVAIDLPGHGDSADAGAEDADKVYSPPGYARLLAGVVAKLGLHDAVFVGWSLGGHIVLEACGQLPDAAGLLIFGTPPVGVPPALDQAFLPNPAMAAGFQAELTEAEMDAYVTSWFAPGVTELPPEFTAAIRRTDGRTRAQLGAAIATANYADEVEIVAGLKTPLAILHGAGEQLVNLGYLGTLALPSLWRGAIQVVPGAGHAPHWEQPERFNELLGAFLRDATGGSTGG